MLISCIIKILTYRVTHYYVVEDWAPAKNITVHVVPRKYFFNIF